MVKDGGVINRGYNKELDYWRGLSEGCEKYLMNLEKNERMISGIDNLKIGYSNIHGYYIQVNKSKSGMVPSRYVRRQTLKNMERYITSELKEYESKVLHSKTRAVYLEKIIYQELIDK